MRSLAPRWSPLALAGALVAGSFACGQEAVPAAGQCRSAGACAPMGALVAMSDQSSSGVGAAALGGATTSFFGVDLGADPQLAVSRGRAFLLARDVDAIFELSPTCGEPLCRISTRDPARSGSTNPQDVAVAPDGSLWVARFALPSVAVLEGGALKQSLPLPDLDGDGNPNASSLRIVDVGGRATAFVALGLLDDRNERQPFRSVRPSALARFDATTRTLLGTTPLAYRNPFNTIVEHGDRMYFTCAGNFDDAAEADAGIESLSPARPDEPHRLVSERVLGGTAAALAVTDGCAAAVVADATKENATAVVTFDPETGEPLRTAAAGGVLFGPTGGYDLWAVAFVDKRLLVADRRRSERGYPIHVFELTGRCELRPVGDPLYVAQKPVALRSRP